MSDVEWVGVSYGRQLLYIALVCNEESHKVTLRFLHNRGGGVYEFKKGGIQEEVDKQLIFYRNVQVVAQGKRGYEVLNMKDVRRSHAEFCKEASSHQKVSFIIPL